jgi:starvation-inducible DNA-binding protein
MTSAALRIISSKQARNRPGRFNTKTPPKVQPYGKIAKLPIALDEKTCASVTENLNQLLADTMTLRDLYKKHHWQVAGSTFYQLHLLFDKHHGEQDELVDQIAERIQLLGGISLAMAADVAEMTIIPRPPVVERNRRYNSRASSKPTK